MTKYAVCILAGLLFMSGSTKEILDSKQKINWLSIEEMQEKFNRESRPVLIDLYTNWCYWCKVMDKKTYNNNKVIGYINDNFYAVKVNAESKDTIEWGKKKFIYNSQNKVNEFALYLTNGHLGFPTTVIFPQINEGPAAVPGYMSPKEIEPVLKYFGEEIYKTQNYKEFTKTFKRSW